MFVYHCIFAMWSIQLLLVFAIVRFSSGQRNFLRKSVEEICDLVDKNKPVWVCDEDFRFEKCRTDERCCRTDSNYFCLSLNNCSIPAIKSTYCEQSATSTPTTVTTSTASTVISQNSSLGSPTTTQIPKVTQSSIFTTSLTTSKESEFAVFNKIRSAICSELERSQTIRDCDKWVEFGERNLRQCTTFENCCSTASFNFCLLMPSLGLKCYNPGVGSCLSSIRGVVSNESSTVANRLALHNQTISATTTSTNSPKTIVKPLSTTTVHPKIFEFEFGDNGTNFEVICKEMTHSETLPNCNALDAVPCRKDKICCSTDSYNICVPKWLNSSHNCSMRETIDEFKRSWCHNTTTKPVISNVAWVGTTTNESITNETTGNITVSSEPSYIAGKGGMLTTTATVKSTTPKFSLDKYNKSELANITIPKKFDLNRCSHGREFELFNSTCQCDAGWVGEICDILRLSESVPMQISLAFESVGGGGVVITLALSVGIYITSGDRHPQAILGCSADFCSLAAQICILFSPIVAGACCIKPISAPGVNDWLCKFVAFLIHFATLSQLNFLLFQSLQAFSVTTYMVDRGFWPIGKFLTLAVGILLPFGWTSVSFTLNSEDFHPAWGCSINFHSKSRDFLIFPLLFTSWTIAIIAESAGMISRRATKPFATDPNEFLSGQSGLRSSVILAVLSSSSILLSSAVLFDFNPIWVSWGFPINLAYSICIFVFHPFENQKFRKFLAKFCKVFCCNNEVPDTQPYSVSFVDLTEMV